MERKAIARFSQFTLEEFLTREEYRIEKDKLTSADLLLVPYGNTEEGEYPSFMMGAYDLAKEFQQEHSKINVQPIYADSIQPLSVVFNDTSIYLGSLILTSVLAPIFVNWVSGRFQNKKRGKEKVDIHITINIYDKGDSFSTSFLHSGSIETMKSEYIPKISEYSDLKRRGKLDQFDGKYLRKSLDEKR